MFSPYCSRNPLYRALWPYVSVGGVLAFALHFLPERFAPSERATWAEIVPVQMFTLALGLVVLLRCSDSFSQSSFSARLHRLYRCPLYRFCPFLHCPYTNNTNKSTKNLLHGPTRTVALCPSMQLGPTVQASTLDS